MLKPQLGPLGYAHRQSFIDRGWRPDALRRALAAEGLALIRRQWIVAPDAPTTIRTAAHAGGRVTCGSAAQLLGIWRPPGDDGAHIALHPRSSSAAPGAIVHRAQPTVPPLRGLVDPVENVLASAATCFPHEDALAVWESALKTGAITPARVLGVAWRGPRARRLAAEAGRLSDSGLETLFATRMRREGIDVRQQARILGRPVDGLIGARLVVQLDGYRYHSDAAQRRADIAHDRLLRLEGYTVFRYGYHDVVHEWPRVLAELHHAVAHGLHRLHR